MRYDEKAELARTWVPELSGLPTQLRHMPWLAASGDESCGRGDFVPGRDYPDPIIEPAGQIGKLKKGSPKKTR
jgi:deoxyribodipyrimidine photolyase